MGNMSLGRGSSNSGGRHSETKRNAVIRNGNLRKLAQQYRDAGEPVPKNVQADIKRTYKEME